MSSLEATSEFLSDLLGPQVDAYEAALELDPLAELDDFMMFENLPASTRATLDERQEWVKRVSRVSLWESPRPRLFFLFVGTPRGTGALMF